MPAKGAYLALAGAGGIVLWSGLKGKKWTSVLRNVVAGNPPQAAESSAAITGSDGTSGGGTVTGVVVPMNQTETAWIKSLLGSLGAPQNNPNVNSISSWIAKETPWPPVAGNNPLNTTYNMPGATDYNSIGVKNYPTPQEGMQATVSTLLGGYPDIVNRLRSGQGLCGWGSAEFVTWSGGGYGQVCLWRQLP